MRILNVTETYAPFLEFGGPPVKVRALAEGLARKGHQVTVLTADWGLEKRAAETGEKNTAERSPFGWRRNENKVETIYLPTWLHYRQLSWNPAVNRYCRAQLEGFDVAHIFGLYDLLGPSAAAACRKLAIPYVVEPIGMFIPIVRNLWLKRIYHRVWGRRMLQVASAIVATSEQEIEEQASGGIARAKIFMRRNGVEVPELWPESGTFRSRFEIPRDTKLVLFLGRLSVKKSPELLLRAFAEAKQRLEGMKLVFAGPDEGRMKAQLEQMAGQLAVRADVQLVGPLFGQNKWAAYRDADVFVLPSQNENFGNTAAEAVATGTPVIVTEQCGIAPLLANEAGLVVKHEVGELAEALARILTDDKLRGHLRAGCAKVTKELGWEGPVREMESLYAKCVSRKGTSGEFQRVE
ncbi:MAG TPA: glycosyltransferase [Candidatus Acidoferrum sp.]|nr:glycosyltransferase [Candidatus Acidoferrum sp.]